MGNAPIESFEKFCFLYMGFMAFVNYNAIVSNVDIFKRIYGLRVYYAINFSLCIPNILIGLWVPKLLNKVSLNKLSYGGIFVQIVSALIHIAIVASIGNSLEASNSARVGTAVIIFFTLFLCSTMFAIMTTLFFGLAGFSHQLIQIHITGLATSGLILSLYLLIVDKITDKPVIKNTLRYTFVILTFLVGIPLYRHIAKLRVPPRNVAELEKETKPEKIGRAIYKKVFHEKWFVLLLYSAEVFKPTGQWFFTFLCFPTLMFIAQSSNPKFDSWPTVLMFIFCVSEVSARILNTMDFKALRGLINEGNVLYFCIFDYACCLVPIFTFLAMRGHIYISPFVCDILNGHFYCLIAFNLGFIGNNLAGLAREGMKGVEMNVLGSYFNFSIDLSVFLGLAVSTLIANVINNKT